MTDSDVLLEGAGFVATMLDDKGLPTTGIESEHVMVLASGVVLYTDPDGASHVSMCLHVVMREPRWSLLNEVTKEQMRDEPDALVCHRCADDLTKIARMNPPVCPACGLCDRG